MLRRGRVVFSLLFVVVWCLSSAPAGAAEVPIVSSSATSNTGNNTPQRSYDGNARSKWMADGSGEHITYDVGSGFELSSILIQFFRGDRQTYTIDILTSLDQANWATEFSGDSARDADFQAFDLATGNARYVRVIGYGNSASNRIALAEVIINAVNGGPANQPPVGDAQAVLVSGTAPLDVDFDATASDDPDGVIVSWDWDFGDTTTGSGETPTHTYDTPSQYNACVTVTDDDGDTDADCVSIDVGSAGGGSPVIYEAEDAVQSGGKHGSRSAGYSGSGYFRYRTQGSYAEFMIDRVSGGSHTLTFRYSLDVGTVPMEVQVNGQVVEPALSFPNGGSWTNWITVSTSATLTSGSNTVRATINVADSLNLDYLEVVGGNGSNQSPVANASGAPTSGEAPITVDFDAAASDDPDGTIVSYDWDFGDTATGSGAATSHEYTSAGSYNACVTVTDDDAATETDCVTINVSDPTGPPTIFRQPTDLTVVEGQPATFSVGATGTQPIFYQWQRNELDVNGATADSFTIATTAAGDDGDRYAVRVSNADGNTLSNQAVLTVRSAATLIPDPVNARWLRFADGRPFFMCGPGDPENFLYRGSRNPDGTRSGDQTDLISKMTGTGANGIYFQIIRSHGGDGVPSDNPFVNSDPSQGLDQDILDQWETWFTAMDEAGITIFVFFFDDNANIWGPGDSVPVAESDFLQQIVNRFEHHRSLIWVIAEEYEEAFSAARVSNMAALVRAADDFGHPIAVHKVSGLSFSEFADDPNIDQFAIQPDENVQSDDALHASMVTAFQDAAGRYNLNMSEAAGHGSGSIARRKNWAIAMGGAYIMVLGWDIASTDTNDLRDCGRLVRFMESTNFAAMEPRDDLAFGDTQYVLANPPFSYILYASSLTGQIGARGIQSGIYDFRWYDILSGAFVDQTGVAVTDGDVTWPRPQGVGSELAVLIQAAADSPPPNQPATANLVASPTSGDPPLMVSFDESGPSVPVAHAQSVYTAEDSTIEIILTASDANGDPLAYVIETLPGNGTLSGVAPDVLYIPDSGFAGPDTFTFAADDGVHRSAPATVSVRVNHFPGATWEVRTPEEVGLEGTKLDGFAVNVGGAGLIVKDGYVVKTWGNQTLPADWASASKPVMSMLLFFAVDEGLLGTVDDLIQAWGWPLLEKDQTMTFRHLANNMSSYARVESPGEAWAYNDYGIQLYQLTLMDVFGQSLDVAAMQRLSPLEFADGLMFTGGGHGISTTPRDFVRIGWLWLNEGHWNGVQLLPRSYFDSYMRPQVPGALPRSTSATSDYLGIGTSGGTSDQTPYGPGIYGYNWWFNARVGTTQTLTWPDAPSDAFQANGHWGQAVVTVIPSLNMVVAARGDWGEFAPGDPSSGINLNLKLLADAVSGN